MFGDAARVRHLLGVLDGHCAAVGRDPAQITKTRLGSVIIAPTHDQAQRRLHALAQANGTPVERLRATVTAGDPDAVIAHATNLLDAGLDGLVFNMPDVHDLDTVALLGTTLAPLLSTRS